ncbi:HD domain-containing protein [Clostridium sp.]|uniref:HD domain-containing protein n=1 Tax=Clostridium sp. TaxID=1506 RepID=UPI003F2D8E43
MERVNDIVFSLKYQEYLKELNNYEKDREFCNHNTEHFIDVARIAYIKSLELGLNYKKDVIYAIAFLHDIGRVLEYRDGTPHHEGSVILAKELLRTSKFSSDEKEKILKCISNHRSETNGELEKIIYESDKLSRSCFSCNVEKDCYWDKAKKNMKIRY